MKLRSGWNIRLRRWSWMWLGALAGAGLAGHAFDIIGWWALKVEYRLLLAGVSAVAGALAAWQFSPRANTAASPQAESLHVLDTSAIIDGRIAEVAETRILGGPLVVPDFVIAELQGIADSSDRARRARGRRGLDVLQRLRSSSQGRLQVWEQSIAGADGQPVDMKLVMLARLLGAKIVTGDYNLNKVATLHDVAVVNLNDVAAALRPTLFPGDALDLELVKTGQEAGQGVGYLDDGTMVVVEGGRDRVGQTVHVAITSVLQTPAGRMIFARV